ncbi:cytosolic phospholipase A2 gamma-like [Chanodichthys erythropterus]|uniref:cytosolic phospholipase A2 gamma-like n=1 Tax=Chanodichthys erythropterus TaxID=933992 RepID=UPI00351F380C
MGASNSRECKCEVRIEHSLNQKEEEFVARRRKAVLQSLKKLQIYVDWDEVPNIALLGSGGGERAMVGFLGSLDQLDKADLLDCILYLSGVSGSTWCMASLYQESDWSTKLETVKDKIIQRLSGPGVNRTDAFAKLKKYYFERDFVDLTDFWAVIVITTFVKEINEHTLTDQWNQQSKDPFPIYTVIDKQSKHHNEGLYVFLSADPWFEISPYEAGYSLTGAFVETSSFGSKFENGCKIKDQPEIDMLYLQALCSSALSDEEEIWEHRKEISGFKPELDILSTAATHLKNIYGVYSKFIPHWFPLQFLLRLLSLPLKKGGVSNMISGLLSGTLRDMFPLLALTTSSESDPNQWIWGTNYNFLHNMKDERVPLALQEKETRDYIDAGLLLNSPYFSVLRKERNIDLIISLDFSDGDPFMTVKEAAEMCKKRNIPFPEVNIPEEDVKKPMDFYVFKGQNTPTVIHIPLFNMINCGDDIETWRKKYKTFQGPYSAEMITDLMEVAGKNITNNKNRLLEEIRVVTETKMYH